MNTNTTRIACLSLLGLALLLPVAGHCAEDAPQPPRVVTLSAETPGGLPRRLFEAVEKNDLAAVRSLLAQGVSPNVLNAETGDWALHLAAAAGRTELVRALLDKGADARAWNREFQTPRELALKSGFAPLAALLKSAEAGTYVRPTPKVVKAPVGGKPKNTKGKSAAQTQAEAYKKLKDYRYVEQNFGYQRW
jgi:Ankyrin repeats (3 copies)